MLGYKVIYRVNGKLVSKADASYVFPAVVGQVLKMRGKGIYLSPSKQYVLDYYSDGDDAEYDDPSKEEVLLTVDFNPGDVTHGNLTDSEGEIAVPSARVVAIERTAGGRRGNPVETLHLRIADEREWAFTFDAKTPHDLAVGIKRAWKAYSDGPWLERVVAAGRTEHPAFATAAKEKEIDEWLAARLASMPSDHRRAASQRQQAEHWKTIAKRELGAPPLFLHVYSPATRDWHPLVLSKAQRRGLATVSYDNPGLDWTRVAVDRSPSKSELEAFLAGARLAVRKTAELGGLLDSATRQAIDAEEWERKRPRGKLKLVPRQNNPLGRAEPLRPVKLRDATVEEIVEATHAVADRAGIKLQKIEWIRSRPGPWVLASVPISMLSFQDIDDSGDERIARAMQYSALPDATMPPGLADYGERSRRRHTRKAYVLDGNHRVLAAWLSKRAVARMWMPLDGFLALQAEAPESVTESSPKRERRGNPVGTHEAEDTELASELPNVPTGRDAMEYVARARAAGAAGELHFIGVGGTGYVLGDARGHAFKVARFDTPSNHGLLEDEYLWLKDAAEVPAIRRLVVPVYRWHEKLAVLERPEVIGRTPRWHEGDALRDQHEKLARANGALWTAPEFKFDSYVLTADGPVLVDAGFALRRGERLLELVDQVLKGEPTHGESPSALAFAVRAEAGKTIEPAHAQALSGQLEALPEPRWPNPAGAATRALPLAEVLRWRPEAARQGVSEVARSPRGFVPAYQAAGGRLERMSPWWRQRREAFLARHLAQVAAHHEPLFDSQGRPSRRHLALVMWGYSPQPKRLSAA